MKRLLDSPLAQRIVGECLGAWMRLVARTTRWEILNAHVPEALRRTGGPVVLVFWHGRILLAHACWMTHNGGMDTKTLISQSREGSVIACAAQTLGIGAIRGSTETKAGKPKGAFDAMRDMMRQLKAKGAIAITPDGPKGPRMRAEMGAVQLAKLSGAPIVGLAWCTERHRVLDSWDRFVIPGPFSRGVYAFGEPIRVDRRADDHAMEAARALVESELIRLTQEVDRRIGATPVEPAAAPAPLPEASGA